MKEAVFGFNDGVVSTFAVIAGMTGGVVNHHTVLLAALATLIAGAFSMGLGTYLGSKSEKDIYENEIKRELWEMEHLPEREAQEIRDIYKKRGFEGELLEQVVSKITGNPKIWLKTMLAEELGFAAEPPQPIKNGLTMSSAFVAGSVLPTFPYFFHSEKILWGNISLLFGVSMAVSILGLFVAGVFKTKFTRKKIIVSALETLFVGIIAAGGSYGIGSLVA